GHVTPEYAVRRSWVDLQVGGLLPNPGVIGWPQQDGNPSSFDWQNNVLLQQLDAAQDLGGNRWRDSEKIHQIVECAGNDRQPARQEVSTTVPQVRAARHGARPQAARMSRHLWCVRYIH